METHFAPARRTERRTLKNQLVDISQSPVMDALLKTTDGILVVLNEDRQIIGLNHSFLDHLRLDNIDEVLGLRLGESLGCIHAFKEPWGCGTTEYCRTCGAAIAMMAAIRDNREEEQICALVSDRGGIISDICLQVKARPIEVDESRWILFYAQDITQQQFWLNMDRVFFHDINNTLTALYGNVQILEMSHSDNKEISSIRMTIERLISEIAVQRNFSHQKGATAYIPAKNQVCLSQIKKELEELIAGHKSAVGKTIRFDWAQEDIVFETDILLVSRILGNMVINALEATAPEGMIRISAKADKKQSITWKVWNRDKIPDPIQKRIFQRYFSSKDETGRGLGTFSMKLFGETYLKGKVAFASSRDEGTLFWFTLPI